MGVDVACGADVAVAQPDLDVLQGDAAGVSCAGLTGIIQKVWRIYKIKEPTEKKPMNRRKSPLEKTFVSPSLTALQSRGSGTFSSAHRRKTDRL